LKSFSVQPMIETQVETPCGVADVAFIDPTEPVKVVPILRAGLVLLENATTLLPAMQTYHLGEAFLQRRGVDILKILDNEFVQA
jgi:uracil phosphoribosyltransferase